jgi:hypothetical protein
MFSLQNMAMQQVEGAVPKDILSQLVSLKICTMNGQIVKRKEFDAMYCDERERSRIVEVLRRIFRESKAGDTRTRLQNDLLRYSGDIHGLSTTPGYRRTSPRDLDVICNTSFTSWYNSALITFPDWAQLETPVNSELIYMKGRTKQWESLAELFPEFTYFELHARYEQIQPRLYTSRVPVGFRTRGVITRGPDAPCPKRKKGTGKKHSLVKRGMSARKGMPRKARSKS